MLHVAVEICRMHEGLGNSLVITSRSGAQETMDVFSQSPAVSKAGILPKLYVSL